MQSLPRFATAGLDARASLACGGIYLTAEDDALFDQMDQERLMAEPRIERIIAISRAECQLLPSDE
jgi:hypothetical protein